MKKPKEKKVYGHSEYDEKYCELVVNMFSRRLGLSDFCKKVGCGRRTIYMWMKRHPEFRVAYEYARECGKSAHDEFIEEKSIIDNSEGAVNYDVKTYMKLHSRRFMDLNRETPPPDIMGTKKDPDLYKAAKNLVTATIEETLTPDQSKILGNVIKTLLEVKEKETLSVKLDEVEKILKSGQQTNNIPVNSPEPEFEEIDDSTAE